MSMSKVALLSFAEHREDFYRMATFFAARSRDPKNNLQKVKMVPHVFGKAGGSH
jgi:hypothetical protein